MREAVTLTDQAFDERGLDPMAVLSACFARDQQRVRTLASHFGASPDLLWLTAELSRIAAALRRLPARDREALLLAAAGELGTAEAARVVGISSSAYKMRLHRARRRLHELLERPDERSFEATERA
jgi:RNA polymerase sigma-70 factor (ECF subfamily)